MRRISRSTVFLVALLGGSGILHFVKPGPYVAIVPKMLPRKRELVYVSGVAELAAAALLAAPRSRRVGGIVAAGLFVAILPANVSMALRSGGRPAVHQVAAWARLPLQAPLVRWAWQAGR